MRTVMAVTKQVNERTGENQKKGQPGEILKQMRPVFGQQVESGDAKQQPESKSLTPGSARAVSMRARWPPALRWAFFVLGSVHFQSSNSCAHGTRSKGVSYMLNVNECTHSCGMTSSKSCFRTAGFAED